MLNCLIVGIGGFVGAASRYLFTLLPFHRSGAFPLHTLLINLIGSFCIGMLVVAASKTSISKTASASKNRRLRRFYDLLDLRTGNH